MAKYFICQVLVLILFLITKFNYCQKIINGYVFEKNAGTLVENVKIVNANQNIVAYSSQYGKFSLEFYDSTEKLVAFKKNFVPILTNICGLKENNLHLTRNEDYKLLFQKGEYESSKETIEIIGKIHIIARSNTDVLGTTFFIVDTRYSFTIKESNSYRFEVPINEITHYGLKSLYIVAWMRESFFKIDSIDVPTIIDMKNKPFRRDFTIEPHQDYIGVLKKDYVSWELEFDQVEQKIDNIEEEKREMQQNNEHLNAKILSLMNSQQKASGIDKLTNDSINHFKEILKENTQKINSLNEEIYQLTDELSKLEKPNMPPSFNEAKDTTELPASKNNSFFDSRVLFIPKHTSLVLNNEYKPYNAYLIGVSTNLNYFFHKHKKYVRFIRENGISLCATIYFPNQRGYRLTPEIYMGLILGKILIFEKLIIEPGVGYGSGYSSYDEYNHSRENQLHLQLSFSYPIRLSHNCGIYAVMYVSDKFSFNESKNIFYWGILGAEIRF